MRDSDAWIESSKGGPMAKTAESTTLGARAELRAWYLGRLRPKLADAVTSGTVEPMAVEALDFQVAELFDLPEDLREEAA
jgi:hypothetical protein